jgi:NAD(P)-dependent dehydrogenase (short-subunit alcohol dehydrogenase family)
MIVLFVSELFPKLGEVAVITGGARGIGVEVVKKLLQCGMHVVIGMKNF